MKTISCSYGTRLGCGLPLVLTEGDGVAPLPLGLPFVELNRGFFGTLVSPASLITIFAWISSSLAAFTFFGQNNVTNLRQHKSKCGAGKESARLRTSRGAFAIYPGLPLQPAWCQERPLCGAQSQPETLSGLQPCHREAYLRQIT